MRKVNPKAVWVLQGWQHNPVKDLMDGLNPGETIILDLMACERPQWGGVTTSMFHKPEGHRITGGYGALYLTSEEKPGCMEK